MQNAEALDLMQAELEEIEGMDEELAHNPFYVRWTNQGKDKWKAEGREEGREEGRAEGREEGKVEAALNLMRNTGLDAQEAARLLGLSPDELQALIAYINLQGKRNSNGNGQHE